MNRGPEKPSRKYRLPRNVGGILNDHLFRFASFGTRVLLRSTVDVSRESILLLRRSGFLCARRQPARRNED